MRAANVLNTKGTEKHTTQAISQSLHTAGCLRDGATSLHLHQSFSFEFRAKTWQTVLHLQAILLENQTQITND